MNLGQWLRRETITPTTEELERTIEDELDELVREHDRVLAEPRQGVYIGADSAYDETT